MANQKKGGGGEHHAQETVNFKKSSKYNPKNLLSRPQLDKIKAVKCDY